MKLSRFACKDCRSDAKKGVTPIGAWTCKGKCGLDMCRHQPKFGGKCGLCVADESKTPTTGSAA